MSKQRADRIRNMVNPLLNRMGSCGISKVTRPLGRGMPGKMGDSTSLYTIVGYLGLKQRLFVTYNTLMSSRLHIQSKLLPVENYSTQDTVQRHMESGTFALRVTTRDIAGSLPDNTVHLSFNATHRFASRACKQYDFPVGFVLEGLEDFLTRAKYSRCARCSTIVDFVEQRFEEAQRMIDEESVEESVAKS